MRKKQAGLILGMALLSTTACANQTSNIILDQSNKTQNNFEGAVEICVYTPWGGNDGNSQIYLDSIQTWQKNTGNIVEDVSGKSDEIFKARIIADFEVGAEPDVLFYFTSSDADSFILADKVISINEIREVYPDYAENMKEELLPCSSADGVKYAVPAFGYWEGLYVNKKVLKKAGVDMPGADYTWETFLEDCEKIKEAGFSPIAAALGNVPHYWFEFVIYNQLSPSTHSKLPRSVEDENGQAWINGIADIKDLYERGYFPENTLSSTDDEIFQTFLDGEAAFLVDGSWKAGGIEERAESPEDFTVTYFPAKGQRKATDIITGLSNGYYITRKAWEDPDKREAAVQFVQYMTSDEVVSEMATIAITALKNGVIIDETKISTLKRDCIKMTGGATGMTDAVQDLITMEGREPIFGGMPQLLTGEVEIEDAVREALEFITEQEEQEDE